MIPRLLAFALLAFVSLIGDAAAQEQAATNRATELRERPAMDARVVAPLAEGAAVKVLARQGGWIQAESGTQRGWVRAFHLRFQSTVQAASGGGGIGSTLTSVFGFGSREAPKTSQVATLGIRGLTAEDFKNASPDPAALKKMQSYRSDKAGAERFAKEAKLAPVQVAYVGSGS